MEQEQVFGRRFLLRKLLGKGAYGSVYSAWDQQASREVALKVVSLEGRRDADNAAARFEREGQVTAALAHPGIVRVHSQGREGMQAWLAYELVPDARTLSDVFRERDRRGRVELIADAAEALAYAHRQSVIHRDVKPENILVDSGGRVLVADFGLAAAQGLDRLTQTGAVMGTPLYMSPEQFALGSLGEVGPPTDVWALGVILYEALTDRPPFQAPGLWELGAQIMHEPPPRPRSVRADVPRDLEAVCLKALVRDPDGRYPTAAEFAADLRRWQLGESVQATRTRPWNLIPRSLRWGLLAAAPALALAAISLGHTPEAGHDPDSVTTVTSRAKVLSLPRWRPKVGDVRWLTFGWEHQQGEGGGHSLGGRIELRLEERIAAVNEGRATVEAKVEALHLQLGDVRFDSSDPTATEHRVRGVVGSSFTYVLQLRPLRLLTLSGASAMGKLARASLASAPSARGGGFLDDLCDEQLGRHVAALYAPTPPATAGLTWESTLEVSPQAGLLISQGCAFERAGSSVTAALVSVETSAPPRAEVSEASVGCALDGRVAQGRIDSLWLTTTYTLRRGDRTTHHRWELFVSPEGGPLGEVPRLDEAVSQFVKPGSRAEAYLEAGYRSKHQGNPDSAHKYFLLSARGGSTQGMLALGVTFEHGEGTALDSRKAIGWYRRAAEAGEPEGRTRMGRIYFNGADDLAANPQKAVSLFQEAIRAGSGRGWEYLGLAYRDGHGKPRDLGEARRCFRKAAEQGCVDAMSFLAEMLAKGVGGEVDLDEAERLLKDALRIFPDEERGIRFRRGLAYIERLRAERRP